ncbi:CAP domain-containing protein [Paraburkholderia strydomiana]|uniref:CAP domain-containing protein n=1 Tax=Paraburkholderia strydomiana TaxID=1245417 RepID=UPI0038BE0247
MNHKNISALTALSFAAAVALSACGGGGGGSSGSGAAAPATTPSGPGNLQTSVPAPTYAASTAQAAIFSQLNAYRSAMGVGLLKQDSVLDTSSSAHALYLVTNLANGGITALSHNEISTNADYYEATPLSRARKAGAPTTEWIAENASAGITQATGDANAGNCLGQFLNTVYHLQGATDAQETIGTGFVTNSAQGTYACVLDFGQTTNVAGSPGDNAFSPVGGQQMATTAIAVSPYDGESNVARSMVAESPNPAPDVAAPGRPVMIRVRADQAGDSLTVTSFTLTANGATVPARTIVPSAALSGSTGATADVNGALFNGVAVLLPLSPLAANTTYTVTFSGQRDGKPITKTTSFTTGA